MWRIEFQTRGSSHIHSILWVDDARKYEVSENSTIEAYIDNFVKCENKISGDASNLTKLQHHRHSHTCRKKGKTCRFNFPLPPMKSTRILEPLPAEMVDSEKKQHKQRWKEIQIEINKSESQKLTFEQFLDHWHRNFI